MALMEGKDWFPQMDTNGFLNAGECCIIFQGESCEEIISLSFVVVFHL